MRCFLILVAVIVSTTFVAAQRFERQSPERTSVTFTNTIVENDSFNIFRDFYAYNGGGVAVGDLDGDGKPDLVFTGTFRAPAVYRNRGDWVFEDVSDRAGLHDIGLAQGVLLADLDGDGDNDLYVCRRYARNSYYVNDGTGRFTDMAETMGLAVDRPSTMASAFDYDRDGDLDLYVALNGSPRRQGYLNPGESDRLFRNDGDRWTDVSTQAGIIDKGYGLSVSVSDVDGDGWPDVYVANDFEERDCLWINQRNGTFRNEATARLQAMSQFSMGSDIADINGDALPDIVTVDMLPDNHERRMTQLGGMSIYGPFFDSTQRIHNTMQINAGNGRFNDVCFLAGMAATDWSWSVLLADYDHDGRTDCFITNGTKRDMGDQDFGYSVAASLAARPDAYVEMPSTRIPNYYYHNVDGLRFDDRTRAAGLYDSLISNGAAWADLDGDGDLDLVVNNTDVPSLLYRNMTVEDARTDAHYLQVVVKGAGKNRAGIGTRLWMYAGTRVWMRDIQPCRGYLSTSEAMAHVGLGSVAYLDSLVALWPDGTSSTVVDVAVDRRLTLAQVAGRGWAPAVVEAPMVAVPNAVLPFRHRENRFDDFKRERLLPYRLSQHGPAVAVGDVNGDGRQDVVCTGAKYSPTMVYLQGADGTFAADPKAGLDDVPDAEDVGLALVDIDGDGDLDCVVVTGGIEFDAEDDELFDRLYRNDGRGRFTPVPGGLPTGRGNGSTVVAADIDGDGDRDLFIGGRSVPGRFPTTPRSFLLRNDKGRFVDVTDTQAPGLATVGMTSAACFADVDGDGDADLVVVGEWLAPQVFRNDRGRFANVTATLGLAGYEGWWTAVAAGDVDGDGDVDIVAGNLGLNGRYRTSPAEPVELLAMDFDDNGSLDPIMSYVVDGVRRPLRAKNTVAGHVPMFNRLFPRHAQYAAITVDDLLPKPLPDTLVRMRATTFATTLFRNDKGRGFTAVPLPDMAQLAPTYGIWIGDADGDGTVDILTAGNSKGPDGDIVGYDAGFGTFLAGDGNGGFTAVRTDSSGWYVPDVARAIATVPWHGTTDTLWIVAVNDGMPRLFRRRTDTVPGKHRR